MNAIKVRGKAYALFPHMSVLDNVGFGLKERRESRQAIEEKVGLMLEVVGLTAFGDRRPSQLSGGQQQRVALARSLVLEPTVLLLDEPLGALDLKMRQHMQVELKNLQDRVGVTFIYVTHDQEEALVMSDRIAVMNHGRIEQIGPSDELYENPRTRFVADFIGETNLMAGKVEALDRETVRVASGALTLFGRRPAEIGPGDAVHVSIRPEKIRSGDECGNCETTTKGVIVDVVYKGSEIRYELRLGDGSRLTYDEQTKHHSRRFAIAGTATVFALLICYPLAYWLGRVVPLRWQTTLLMSVIILFWTSFLIRTYAWIGILQERGLLDLTVMVLGLSEQPLGVLFTRTAVIIGFVHVFLPLMLMPIYAAVRNLDPNLLLAAQDLGATPVRTFFRVTLPLIAPGVVSANLVSFAVSFDEFVVGFFVSGKGVVTLPLFLYSELRFSVTPEINAISTFVLVISVLVIGLMQWLQGRVSQRS